MMRIFWVIKFVRYFIGFQIFGLIFKRCYREMVMLFVFICVVMVIFSVFFQFFEYGLDLEIFNKDFVSIFVVCWWVIIFMIIVGYGDMYFIIVFGRIFGGVCVVSGIVLLVLLIIFIYYSFVQCYYEFKFRLVRYSRSFFVEFLN